jgi:outer membrane protein assembly factor BamB
MSVEELRTYRAGRRTSALCRVAAAARRAAFVAASLFPLLQCAAAPVFADSLGWRGDGSGRYSDAKPPAQWDMDEGKNILWRTKVGKSQSTPVVVGNRVLVAAERDMLVCVDRSSGKILWTKDNGPAAVPPGLSC